MLPFYEYRCSQGHVILTERDSIPVIVCWCKEPSYSFGPVAVKLHRPTHGTHSTYAHGCRCPTCREAERQYSQSRRDGVKYRTTVATTTGYRERAHNDLVDYMEQNT